MLEIKFSGKMKKDLKRAVKRGKDPEKLTEILDLPARLVPLAQKHHDHTLSGEWQGFRECHIENDWLLVYRVDRNALILSLNSHLLNRTHPRLRRGRSPIFPAMYKTPVYRT